MDKREIDDHISREIKTRNPIEKINYVLYKLIDKKKGHINILTRNTKTELYKLLADYCQEALSYIPDREKGSYETLKRMFLRHAGIPDRKEWAGKNPFVFSLDNKKNVMDIVQYWHDYFKPDYVFLTECSAIPYGYAIKSAWKRAYPEEASPKFYRVESWSSGFQRGEKRGADAHNAKIDSAKKEAIKKYFKKRVKNPKSTIILFDEHGKDLVPHQREAPILYGPTLSGPAKSLKEEFPEAEVYIAGPSTGTPHKFGKEWRTEHRAEFGRYSKIPSQITHVTEKQFVRSSNRKEIEYGYKSSEEEIAERIIEGKYNPVGKLIKEPIRRKLALEYISDLKQLGAEAGQELREELEKKKKLEHVVSGVLAVGGLVSSLFFLSSNITGNAIANVSQSSGNILGAVLLVVGLVAGFFWMKKK